MKNLFDQRSSSVEIMDDLAFRDEVLFKTLDEIDFINKWLGGNNLTLKAVDKMLASCKSNSPIAIADLGCGSGEILRLIADHAREKNLQVKLSGFDANPVIADYARAKSQKNNNIEYHALNIFSPAFSQHSFDIVIATLFIHHFSEVELVRLFTSLKKQARVGIVINDLHRHPLAYYSIKWLTRIFSKSYMVKYDAPLSVLRAFKRKELESILENAGITRYEIKWKWAFRWELIIY